MSNGGEKEETGAGVCDNKPAVPTPILDEDAA